MPMPEWMKDPKLASDPAWSLARAWYVGEVCEKIMMMADEQGLVKASKVVDLLLDRTRRSKPWLTMVDTRVEVSGFVRPRRWG